MSHFCVYVVGEDPAYQLAPFHEYECTGQADEFIKSVDETAKLRERYETETKTFLQGPHGNFLSPYEDMFFRDPTPKESAENPDMIGSGSSGGVFWSSRDWGDGRGYRPKIKFIPEGWKEVDLIGKDRVSFLEWVQEETEKPLIGERDAPDLKGLHKWGWVRARGDTVLEVIDRTNPGAQWDWYEVGGRWAGRLLLKPDVQTAGRPRPNFSHGWSENDKAEALRNPRRVDSALKGEIDFQAMREKAAQEAGDSWDKHTMIVDGRSWLTWEEVRAKHGENIQAARDEYHGQPVIKDLNIRAGYYEEETLRISREACMHAGCA